MVDQSKDYMRRQLVKHIEGGEAFMAVKDLLEKVPFSQLGIIPEGLPYSFYQQFYHIRFAQYDILEFSRNPKYQAPKWPDDYWTEYPAPEKLSNWEEIRKLFFRERKEFIDLILGGDIYQPFSHGNGQTLFREALLIIEHNAYHIGQLLVISRLLRIY